MKYIKKPVIVEAIMWTGDNQEEINKFCTNPNSTCKAYYHDIYNDGNYVLKIRTLEGDHIANIGDYIIKGIKGEFYPCKPDIFELTYDKLDA